MIVQMYVSVDGDWIDIFINGSKVYEGHSITPYALLELLAAVETTDISLAPLVTWNYAREDDPENAAIEWYDRMALGVAV
jgi:hypothetical protein